VTIEVRSLEPGDAAACDDIVLGLPYHFGLEEGRRRCADAVRTESGFVVADGDDVLGFLTYTHPYDDVAEITWMAIRADRRRQGLGGRLVDALAERASAERRRLLIVLTVSASDGPDEIEGGYDATRAFYLANGFVPTRDFAGYWDSDTPVLMTRVL
jgi:ribosomal protein S18 acetylase RimI-like enzyme